jgi:hypothetical protein
MVSGGSVLIYFAYLSRKCNHNTMKKCILHILLLAAICAVCSRCNHLRDEDNPADECYYDGSVEGLKQWYYYKVGTYWIYEDVNSGLRDTLTVIENDESPEGAVIASCEFKAYSTFYDGYILVYFDDSYTIHCLNHRACNCRKIQWGYYDLLPGVTGGGWYFLYPHIPNNYNNVNGAVSILQSYNQEVIVQDSLYRNVVIYNAENSFIEGPQVGGDSGTQVYFSIAKNHFIIRKQVPEYNQDWQLIEHTIVQ